MRFISNWLAQRFYPRVNTRITVPFLIITVVIAGLGVFIVTRLVASSIDERLNNQLLSSAQAATNAMIEIEKEQLAALRSMTFTEGVDVAIGQNDINQLSILLSPIAINNQLDNIIVFDTAGTPVYALSYDSFREQLAEITIESDFRLDSISRVLEIDNDELGDKFIDVIHDSNSTIFYISAPVVNDDNFIVGAISVGFNSNNVLRRLTEQALAKLTIYDNSGTILSTGFRTNLDVLLLPEQELLQIIDDVEHISPIREIMVQEVPHRLLYVPFEIRSQRIGLLAAGLQTDFVVEQIGVSRNIFIVLFGFLFFAVALIGIFVTRSIVRPITELVDTTRAIQEGDLTRRVGLGLPDEIGELSLSFDSMTDRLVQRNDEIQDLYSQQLEETARRDAILSSITDAVIVRGQDGKVVMLNPAATRLLEELQDDPEEFGKFMQLQWEPDELAVARNVMVANKHFSVSATPVFMDSRRLLGYIIVFHDITAMVAAERLKDEMILQLSHELRTPLSSVRGYVELLKIMNSASLDRQSQSFINKTVDQLDVLERMVNQVIDVSAILAEDIEVESEAINLSKLLQKIAGEHSRVIQERKQRLSLSLPEYTVWIQADLRQLTQVFDHIIRNAYNYTPEGGWLEIAMELPDSESVNIYFIDNGVGIASDEILHVFDRMYRGRSAEAGITDTRGLGLGLFLSREIITAHLGTITIDSKPNMGTIVTITLPSIQEKA